jgi:hypothetical protein
MKKGTCAFAFVVAFVVAVAAPAATAATTVWRCGPDGRVYTDTPCLKGVQGMPGREVDVSDPRTAEQVAQGREVLAADIRRAEAMRRDRLEREAAERRLLAAAAAVPLKKTALRQPAAAEKGKPPKPRKAQPLPKRPAAADAADGIWRATAVASRRTPG